MTLDVGLERLAFYRLKLRKVKKNKMIEKMTVRFDPVFIIAYSRSDTEMLSHILHGHPMISISPEGPRGWEILYPEIGKRYCIQEKINHVVDTMINFDRRFSDVQERVIL